MPVCRTETGWLVTPNLKWIASTGQDAVRKLVDAVGQIGESGALCKTEGDLAAGEQCGNLI